jgi:GT2 family glycosyltransferase
VRRELFDALGGYDERFWFWYEDVDLARRLRDRGELLHVGGAVFEHLGGRTFAAWGSERGLRSRLLGIARYAEVHLGPASRALLGIALVASAAVRVPAFALLGRGATARAWAYGARLGLGLAATSVRG